MKIDRNYINMSKGSYFPQRRNNFVLFLTALICLSAAGLRAGVSDTQDAVTNQVGSPSTPSAEFAENGSTRFPELVYEEEVLGLGSIGTPKEEFVSNFESAVSRFGSGTGETLKVGTYDLGGGDVIHYYFTGGVSDDPALIATLNDTEDPEGYIYIEGSEFHIFGDSFYVEGTGPASAIRKKFQFNGEAFQEVKPAFYYVNISGLLRRNVTLYSDKMKSKVVANIAAGQEAEILLADSDLAMPCEGKFILVKTKFGMLGWVELQSDDIVPAGAMSLGGGLMDGLYYAP